MKAKTKIKKYEELWIKNKVTNSVTKKSDDYDYDEKYIKIRLNSDDESPLNKTVEISTITIVVRAFFKKIKNKILSTSFLR